MILTDICSLSPYFDDLSLSPHRDGALAHLVGLMCISPYLVGLLSLMNMGPILELDGLVSLMSYEPLPR